MSARLPALLIQWTLGVALITWRYLWMTTVLHRSNQPGDARDAPPALPAHLVDDRSQRLEHGVGALYHRIFTVGILDSSLSAKELIDCLAENLNRGVPREVVRVEVAGSGSGRLRDGEELVVRMPGPYDGPVRVVHRDETSFRFATLVGHMEAGQIEFRAQDAAAGLSFRIEAWARPGDRLVQVLYSWLWFASEIQLNMWVRFCLKAVDIACGRPDSGITIRTRVVDDPDELRSCIEAERPDTRAGEPARAAPGGAMGRGDHRLPVSGKRSGPGGGER
jgi:hypothetical protein